jgi:hypothetical protein
MQNPPLQYYVVYDKFQPTKIIATVGISNEEIQCIAYHYDFKDQNLDSKVSLGEYFWLSQKSSWDLHIAYSLMIHGVAFDVGLMQKSIKDILQTGAQAAVDATQYAYFQILVGIPISQLLTAAGVTGIRKVIYNTAIKSILKGVVL